MDISQEKVLKVKEGNILGGCLKYQVIFGFSLVNKENS